MKKQQKPRQSHDQWQTPLEEVLLKQEPHMTLLTALEEILSAFPTNYSLKIDITTDKASETVQVLQTQTSATDVDTTDHS
jgi:hypothetical protein